MRIFIINFTIREHCSYINEFCVYVIYINLYTSTLSKQCSLKAEMRFQFQYISCYTIVNFSFPHVYKYFLPKYRTLERYNPIHNNTE